MATGAKYGGWTPKRLVNGRPALTCPTARAHPWHPGKVPRQQGLRALHRRRAAHHAGAGARAAHQTLRHSASSCHILTVAVLRAPAAALARFPRGCACSAGRGVRPSGDGQASRGTQLLQVVMHLQCARPCKTATSVRSRAAGCARPSILTAAPLQAASRHSAFTTLRSALSWAGISSSGRCCSSATAAAAACGLPAFVQPRALLLTCTPRLCDALRSQRLSMRLMLGACCVRSRLPPLGLHTL